MLKMGCAKRDVTPDFPVMLHGYGARCHETSTVEDPIELGVIIVQQDGKKVLIVTADVSGIYLNWCVKIKAALKERFGYEADDVWISSSHTHFAPAFWDFAVVGGKDLPYGFYHNDGRFYELWMTRLFEAVAEAENSLSEASLECVDLPVSGIAFNRRTVRKDNGKVDTNYTYPANAADYDFSPIDNRLSVWRFSKAGAPAAILARYSCHPVTGGAEYYGISADYPGAFKRAVQRYLGCPGYFMLGTAGDVVPMRRNGTSREDLGEILARSIQLNELRFQKADDFKLATGSFTVKSHIARLDGYDRSQRETRWKNALKAAQPSDYDLPLAMESYRYSMAERYPDTDDPEIPIQLMRLGAKVLVGLPFEVVSQIGLQLSAACPEAVITSITGGYEGYLPLGADFPKGGYETEMGAEFSPQTGDYVLAAAIEKVKAFQKA